MSRLYEALQQAERERKSLGEPESSLSDFSRATTSVTSQRFDREKEMILLYQNIVALSPDLSARVIQFVGCNEGEGTTTIIGDFARVVSRRLNKKVLLLDADRNNPSWHLSLKTKLRKSWPDFLKEGETAGIEEILYETENANLFVAPVSLDSKAASQALDPLRMKGFFEELKRRFELVLVDSPPAVLSADGIALCRGVDGIVLVLEAEKTRWPVAEKVKEQILMSGGNILGTVFNKIRRHIPGFIYGRL